MLRDDRQVALNQVLVACEEAAERHLLAAERLADDAESALLASLARERADVAEELAEEVRRLGDLPDTPDADREAVEEVIGWIKTALGGDEREHLLAQADKDEAILAQRLDAALAQDLAAATREVLERLGDQVPRARRRLARLRGAPTP